MSHRREEIFSVRRCQAEEDQRKRSFVHSVIVELSSNAEKKTFSSR